MEYFWCNKITIIPFLALKSKIDFESTRVIFKSYFIPLPNIRNFIMSKVICRPLDCKVKTNINTRTHTNTSKNANIWWNSVFTFHGLEEVAGGALNHAGHLLPAETSHLVEHIPWFSNNLNLWELEQTGSSLTKSLFFPNRASRVIKVIKGLQVKLFWGAEVLPHSPAQIPHCPEMDKFSRSYYHEPHQRRSPF